MNHRRKHLERDADTGAGVQDWVTGISVNAMVSDGGYGGKFLPEARGSGRVGAHLAVKDHLRPHRDYEFDSQLRPLLRGGIRDVVGIGELQQIVKESSRPDGDERLVPDQHQHPRLARGGDPPLNVRDLRIQSREQGSSRIRSPDSIANRADAVLDLCDRVVLNGHYRTAQFLERTNFAQFGRQANTDYQRRMKSDDGFNVWGQKRSHLRQAGRRRRIIAVLRNADYFASGSEREQNLRNR